MKILVINGANMNMLGRREPDIYGKEDYAALCARIYEHAQSRGVAVECFQSNHEGAIIDAIQEEQTLICYGLRGALQGLVEQGCNGPCKDALDKLDKHLNKSAHPHIKED